MLSFQLTEDQALIVGTVADVVKSAVIPGVRDHEAAGALPPGLIATLHELGLGQASVPEAAGGPGLGWLTAALINEELAAGDAAVPFAAPGFGPYAAAVLALASGERATELLAPVLAEGGWAGAVAWSEPAPCRDRAGFVTRATPTAAGGWELTGEKSFVTHAATASRFIVFAQVDDAAGWGGLGAFVVERSTPGVEVTARRATLGLNAASVGGVRLTRAALPGAARLVPSGDFTLAVARFFATYGLMVAARQAGLARAAFDLMREYGDLRRAFGKPIAHFQAVAFTLADRHMDAESARELVRRAAWAFDAGKDPKVALHWAAQAIAHAHEAAMRAADDCVQLHGGAGFIRDLVAEKLMRDAKQMALCGMTAEHADQLAAALALGGPLDPALVLPTPDTQCVIT